MTHKMLAPKILYALFPVLCLFFFSIPLAHAGRLDSAWTTQDVMTVDNTANANALTDYHVSTTLNTAILISSNEMRSDCGDIRVTDSDGTTLLNYWIEDNTCNTSATKIWVKVPSISANSSATLYLYYGNLSSTSVSSWNSTILPYTEAQVTSNAAFSSRYSHTSVVYDNKMWVMGGFDHVVGRLNDVWSSTDGITWTQVTSSAGWSPRIAFQAVVFDNKMWVMGGNASAGRMHDVWYSTNGADWTQATAAAAWPIRSSFSAITYDNKMWVMGGGPSSTYSQDTNDVWYSTNGSDWTQATAAAAWGIRGGQTSFVYDNKMWIMGGFLNGTTNYNDVWSSSDGTTWSQVTASANWSQRMYASGVVYDNKMWILGGSIYSGGVINKNDVWYSTNGSDWTQATAAGSWTARRIFSAVIFDSKMIIVGGFSTASVYLNDVWVLMRSYAFPEPTVTLDSPATVPEFVDYLLYLTIVSCFGMVMYQFKRSGR